MDGHSSGFWAEEEGNGEPVCVLVVYVGIEGGSCELALGGSLTACISGKDTLEAC
jgi:hypothetical protein